MNGPDRTSWPLLLGCAWLSGCATIHTSSEVRLVEREDTPVRQIGAAEHVSARRHEANWVQLGGELVVELHEHPSCQRIKHVPVVRVERIRRRSDHTLVLEYILTAGTASFSAFAFASPRNFGGEYISREGDIVLDPRAGYRVGGVFAGIAAIGLIASVYDTIRVRDTVLYADAFAVVDGGPVPCLHPRRTLGGAVVTFIFEDYERVARTDPEGRTRIPLPALARFADPEGRVDPRLVDASIRIDDEHAVRVAFRVPYGDGVLATHGHVTPQEELEP